MIDITADGHFQGTGEGFEDALDFVMLVLAFGTNVEIHLGSITETLEEMQEHLRRHLSYLLTMELSIPYQPRTTTKIEGDTTQAVIHRQTISITFNTALVTQRLQDTFA